MKIHIYDSPWGNQSSISNSLRLIGLDASITSAADAYHSADILILPGVGNFSDASSYIHDSGDFNTLSLYANSGRPLLGICLGMQLMFSTSEEAPNKVGLGLIPGQVLSFKSTLSSQITNTGFKSIYGRTDASLHDTMYFTHSYFCQPSDSSIVSSYSTFQGTEFCASFIVDNLIGMQFHPEKSGHAGLKILKKLLSL